MFNIDFRLLKLVYLFLYVLIGNIYILPNNVQAFVIIFLLILHVYRYSDLSIPKSSILVSVFLLAPIIYALLTLDISPKLAPQLIFFLLIFIILHNYSRGITSELLKKSFLISVIVLTPITYVDQSAFMGMIELLILSVCILWNRLTLQLLALFLFVIILLYIDMDMPKTLIAGLLLALLSNKYTMLCSRKFIIAYTLSLIIVPSLAVYSLSLFPELEATTHILSGRPFIWEYWYSVIQENTSVFGIGSYHSEFYDSLLSQSQGAAGYMENISQPHSIILHSYLFNGGVVGVLLLYAFIYLNLDRLRSNGMISVFYVTSFYMSFSITGPMFSSHPIIVLFIMSLSCNPVAILKHSKVGFYTLYVWYLRIFRF
jgi:hypothetical protein